MRFDYYSNKRKHGVEPSPLTYNCNRIPNNRGSKSFLHEGDRGNAFGRSRFPVEAILKPYPLKDLDVPGPGTHELGYSWVTP